ncbi:MAG: autotransporter domain-containing protein [Luteolibacter sp.]
MKPKLRTTTRSLPLMITIAMSAPCVTSAAIFNDDSGGNAQPTSADNGETTIIADGGTSLTPFVTIGDGVNLNGQDDQTAVLILANDPYTVNIAGAGILAANSNQDAINSTTGFTLFNSGIVAGFGTSQGIDGVGSGTIIHNSGTISGPDDAIRFSGSGAIVNNLLGGLIDGIGGASSDGIQGSNNFTLNNNGTVRGTDNGVLVKNNGTISNLTNFDPFSPFGPISGGSITGTDTGIEAGNGLKVFNNNLGTITGTNGNGITAGNNAEITNYSGGTITGTNGDGINTKNNAIITNELGANISGGVRGVNAGSGLTVTNSGSITGLSNDGIAASTNAKITNTGTITGNGIFGDGIELTDDGTVTNSGSIISDADFGIDAFGGGTFTLNNSGLIQGGAGAFIGNFSGSLDSTLNLNLGSRLVGSVVAGGGTDIINFDGGLTSHFNSASGSSSNSILGDVTGIETINKNGSGVAFIGVPNNGGFNVSADIININSGGLYINADIAGANGPQSTINAGGAALGGTGIWNADIFITAGGISAGAIPINLDSTPSNSVGTVEIIGNVIHSPGSFIRFDVNPGAIIDGVNSDLIRHTSMWTTYDINGAGIRIAATDNNRVIRNGVYTVVDSDAPITGMLAGVTVQFNQNVNNADTGFVGTEINNGTNNANTVLANFFTTASKTDSSTNLILTVNHDFSSLVTDPNAIAFGNALDASINSMNSIDQDFIAALDYSDLATVQATLNSASPTESFSTTAAIASGNQHINRVVQDHLALTRASGDTVRSYVGTYSEPAPEPMVRNSGNGNVWGNVSYSWKEVDSDLANDFDGEEASFTAGVDYRVAPNLLLGVLLNGSTADYDFTGGSSDVDSFRAVIYGTYGESTGIYSDFLVGYGSHDTDLSRSAGLLGTLNSSPDADSLQAMVTVGYAMQAGSVKHGPFGGVEYQNIDVDGYTQSGPFPLVVSGYDAESIRLIAGYRAEADYGRFSPYASVAYAHELHDDNLTTTAALPGGAGFGVVGSGLESAILISLGTNYAINDALSLNGGYYGEVAVGGDGTDSHGASFGVNYSF